MLMIHVIIGVGSQGDGTAQVVCRSEADMLKAAEVRATTANTVCFLYYIEHKGARKGLAQPQAWRVRLVVEQACELA